MLAQVKLCLNTNDRTLYAVKSIDKKQLRQRGLRMQRPGQPPLDPLAPVRTPFSCKARHFSVHGRAMRRSKRPVFRAGDIFLTAPAPPLP